MGGGGGGGVEEGGGKAPLGANSFLQEQSPFQRTKNYISQ